MKYEAPKTEFVSFCVEDILMNTAGDNSLSMDYFKFKIEETLNF